MPTWKFNMGDLNSGHPDYSNNIKNLSEFLCPQELEIVCVLDKAVVDAKKECATIGKYKDEIKTKHILCNLDKLGEELGYEPRSKFSGTEWLFDEVWLIKKQKPWPNGKWGGFEGLKNEKWGGFEGLKLACESEWHGRPDKVLDDFSKLTIANADFRLFVHSKSEYNVSFSEVDLCKSILNYSSGARYLFFGIGNLNSVEIKIQIDFIIA